MIRSANSSNNSSITNKPPSEQQVSILQANLHKSKERTHGILNDPNTQKYTAMLLQEQFWSTYTKESPHHHGWNRYEPTNKDTPPRAAIYINNSQLTPSQITQIPIHLTDVVALQIQPSRDDPPLTIINVYNPSDNSLIQQLQNELRKVQVRQEEMIIMAGDFNCHHPLWNPPAYLNHDNTAEELVELAAHFGLSLLIPPGTITYPAANTAIDLTWGNSKAQESLLKCQVATDADQGADHLPIETILRYSSAYTQDKQQRLDISRTNWGLFDEKLKATLPVSIQTPQTCEQTEACTITLIQAIQQALKDSTPTKRICPRSKRWWNSDLTELAKEHRRLRNRMKRRKTPLDIQLWKTKSNQYSTAIAKAKDKCWQQFVQKANGKSIWDIKRYLTMSQSQTNISVLEDANSYANMSKLLQQNFFPEPPPADLTDIKDRTGYPTAVSMNSSITVEQIQRAVRKAAPNKAPGPDQITNKVLQHALPIIEQWLQKILQATLNLGYYPQVLKATTTVVLRKPGKPDYTKVKAYRPIALESTIGKVFESVIAEMLSYLTEKYDLLPAHHFGGRPGRSTEDALMILMENVYKAWKKGQVYSAVFLDVAGAFNYVHHVRLYDNLRKREVPGNLARWLLSFLQGRTTKLQFNGATSDEINVPAGVPQGSPLSPLLFMFYNADLLEEFTNTSDLTLGFIDDVVYGTAGTSDIANARRLKQMLQKAEVWRKRHGAQFEVSKYILIHFTRNPHKTTRAAVTINGTKTPPSDEAKYLGVILDKQLRFKAHMQYAIKKGTNAALALNSIGKATWGAPYKYIRQLFQSVVATRMDYGAVIWHRPKADGSTAATMQARKLTTVQRIAMKATLACYRTTPTTSMEVESGIMPAHLRLQTKTLAAVVRFQSLSRKHPIQRWLARARKKVLSDGKISYLSNLENIMGEFPLTLEPVERKEPFQQAPWAKQPPASLQANDKLPSKEEQRKKIKSVAREMWKEQWEKTNSLHLYKIIATDINNGPALYAQLKHRSHTAMLVQLRTGHCGLNHYLARFKKIETSECTNCGYERETVEHFLLECPTYWEARRDLRKKVGMAGMSLQGLLGKRENTKATMEYVDKTRRFMEEG
jgi:Reverse transcriptase (RNA-dependent DNA polymerase)/Endonuclease-reverse transcriptase